MLSRWTDQFSSFQIDIELWIACEALPTLWVEQKNGDDAFFRLKGHSKERIKMSTLFQSFQCLSRSLSLSL